MDRVGCFAIIFVIYKFINALHLAHFSIILVEDRCNEHKDMCRVRRLLIEALRAIIVGQPHLK